WMDERTDVAVVCVWRQIEGTSRSVVFGDTAETWPGYHSFSLSVHSGHSAFGALSDENLTLWLCRRRRSTSMTTWHTRLLSNTTDWTVLFRVKSLSLSHSHTL